MMKKESRCGRHVDKPNVSKALVLMPMQFHPPYNDLYGPSWLHFTGESVRPDFSQILLTDGAARLDPAIFIR